jgi:hypothetical protein
LGWEIDKLAAKKVRQTLEEKRESSARPLKDIVAIAASDRARKHTKKFVHFLLRSSDLLLQSAG